MVQAVLRDLILDAYPTAQVRIVSTASDLADYTHDGADLVILSDTFASVTRNARDTPMMLRGMAASTSPIHLSTAS